MIFGAGSGLDTLHPASAAVHCAGGTQSRRVSMENMTPAPALSERTVQRPKVQCARGSDAKWRRGKRDEGRGAAGFLH